MGMGDRIKERRLRMGYTQDELGALLGLQKSAIAKYENGRVENIKRSVIAKMSEILECSPAYLMDLGDEEPKRISGQPTFLELPSGNIDCSNTMENEIVTAIRKLEKENPEEWEVLGSCYSQIPYLNPDSRKYIADMLRYLVNREIEKQMEKQVTYVRTTTSKSLPNAAHADDYANASEELKKQEADIMDDDNF